MSDLDGILTELANDKHLLDLTYTPDHVTRHKRAVEIIERKKALRDRLTKESEAVEDAEIDNLADEYTYTGVKNMRGFAMYAKREFFFDCLRDIVPFAYKSWAKTSVTKLLKKSYVERYRSAASFFIGPFSLRRSRRNWGRWSRASPRR
ncbi:MAG: hypothetical protein P4M11_10020 [Candidatus Pacebacteria bacterium]|nr:hypothetical protein [Candidatus Paceibacterota bacterium]